MDTTMDLEGRIQAVNTILEAYPAGNASRVARDGVSMETYPF